MVIEKEFTKNNNEINLPGDNQSMAFAVQLRGCASCIYYMIKIQHTRLKFWSLMYLKSPSLNLTVEDVLEVAWAAAVDVFAVKNLYTLAKEEQGKMEILQQQ